MPETETPTCSRPRGVWKFFRLYVPRGEMPYVNLPASVPIPEDCVRDINDPNNYVCRTNPRPATPIPNIGTSFYPDEEIPYELLTSNERERMNSCAHNFLSRYEYMPITLKAPSVRGGLISLLASHLQTQPGGFVLYQEALENALSKAESEGMVKINATKKTIRLGANRTKNQLIEEATRRGIPVKKSMTKAQLEALIL